jgi:hypothetical protein
VRSTRIPLSLAFAATLVVAQAQTNFDFGVGNTPITSTDNLQDSPFSTAWSCASFQQIITAAELQAQGVQPGWRIDSTWLIFDVAPGLHWQNVAVYAAHTTDSHYVQDGAFSYPQVGRLLGLNLLHAPQPTTDVVGWNVFDSDYGVPWDGVNNLVVEFVVSGGTSEYPNGTGDWGNSFGPTIRGTTYAPPAGPGTYRACATYKAASTSNTNCQDYYSTPHNTLFDMRLVFTPEAINDTCDYYYVLQESPTAIPQLFQGGTTTPGLPGNPPLVDEIWYAVRNDHLNPRAYTVFACGANDFDAAVAVYRGPCGAFVYEAFDDDGCGTPGGGFQITFDVQPNETVFLAVGRSAGTPPPSSPYPVFLIGTTSATYASTAGIGTGCGFGGAAPPLLTATTPSLGAMGTIAVAGAPAPSFVALFVGAPSPGSTFLDTGCPFHLDMPASYLLTIGLTDAVGAWSITAPLPSSPTLIGVAIGVQAAVLSPFHAPPIGTTNAVLLTFGA